LDPESLKIQNGQNTAWKRLLQLHESSHTLGKTFKMQRTRLLAVFVCSHRVAKTFKSLMLKG